MSSAKRRPFCLGLNELKPVAVEILMEVISTNICVKFIHILQGYFTGTSFHWMTSLEVCIL